MIQIQQEKQNETDDVRNDGSAAEYASKQRKFTQHLIDIERNSPSAAVSLAPSASIISY